MKIDQTKLKKGPSNVPPDCKALIDRLKLCEDEELLEILSEIKTWNYGRCQLFHWSDILDRFDHILQLSCQKVKENQWCLPCDAPDESRLNKLVLSMLNFTALLVENSFNQHIYNSIEHLTALLSSSDMNVVLAVLNLLYVFSKRSNFISKLNHDQRQKLVVWLSYLAESWGGKENGFGLAECCQNLPITTYPSTASTLHFEYYAENADTKARKKTSNTVIAIHIDNVDRLCFKTASEIMEDLVEKYAVPEDKQMQLFSHIRLAHSFSDYPKRILCVQARLQALSVLVYCNGLPEKVNSVVYHGLIEELVNILELQDNDLMETKAVALRTLASILRHNVNKLSTIIEATGVSSYHGFLPVLVRSCIQSLTEPDCEPFPLPFATALFSFLYCLAHATNESGGEALVSCGMIEALLKVVNWRSTETRHITLATRAVRIIDIIRSFDKQAFIQTFQAHGGLSSFIRRLEMEVNTCRNDQPFVIIPKMKTIDSESQTEAATSTLPTSDTQNEAIPNSPSTSDNQAIMEVDSGLGDVDFRLLPGLQPETSFQNPTNTESEDMDSNKEEESTQSKKDIQCLQPRAALVRSIINFLKKAIQDSVFSESIRHLMDGTLPHSLKHIISNPEYYGTSIFQLAIDVVTVYVFQEPTLLSALQNNGLADVVLHALLVQKIPAKRRVLASISNVFSALCLNVRGLQSFVACKPFEKLFRVFVLPEYLPVMRRRRGSDFDPVNNIGSAVDELMRHQPSLRKDAIAAVIKLLEELRDIGSDPNYICSKPLARPATVTSSFTRMFDVASEADSSEEDDSRDEDATEVPVQVPLPKSATERGTTSESNHQGPKTSVPLVDYVLNVARFVDAILSNNSTNDHCREFVQQKGLVHLVSMLALPNLPIDFPVTPTCQAISSVCKSILTLAFEPKVLIQGFVFLYDYLNYLEPLHMPSDPPGGSVLLEKFVSASMSDNFALCAWSTPTLHNMTVVHSCINMFVHVCQTGQSDIRTILVSHWGSELGLSTLGGLSALYTALIWETTVLLSLCNNDSLPEDCQVGRQQLKKLIPKDFKMDVDDASSPKPSEVGPNSVATAMGALSTNNISAMDIDNSVSSASKDSGSCSSVDSDKIRSKLYHAQIKEVKPLISVASRLGQSLAELLELLVKLCVGLPMRQRRFQQQIPQIVPSPAAHAVAAALTRLLKRGLCWERVLKSPMTKFRLTYYVCSLGFTSRMLFDEKSYPYHLMLQKFLSCGGLDAFFNAFQWAMTLENTTIIEDEVETSQLPESTGEFLDVWLMLLEKLVNPKNVLESPHTLPPNQKNSPTFNPALYLVHIRKRAFESIMYLWNRKPLAVNGERIAESMLAVICHLMKEEETMKEKPTVTPEDINQDQLTQLMNMGFSRGLATEALVNTSSLEQATEYVLNYPAIRSGSSSGNAEASSSMEWQLSEEEQMLRAIAMSLGENAIVSTDEDKSESKQPEKVKEPEFELKEEEPLSKQAIDEFTSQIVDGCLCLADTLPDSVYRICDLLISVSVRNGEEWRNKCLIDFLLEQLQSQISHVLLHLNSEEDENEQSFSIGTKLQNMESKLAVRLHLFTLIFEKMKIPCAVGIEERNLISLFIHLLELSSSCMKLVPKGRTPKWLPFLVLLTDLYEKSAIMSIRKATLLSFPKRQWKWCDRRRMSWNNYCSTNNKLIDDAYKSGETTLRFTTKGKKYKVCLTTMVQINEETGRSRPIMFTTDSPTEETTGKDEKKSKEQVQISEEIAAEGVSNFEEVQSLDVKNPQPQPEFKIIAKLTADQCEKLVEICVSLLSLRLEPDIVHSIMRLCLQLTRTHSNAVLFANLNGPNILLSLTEPYSFTGFISLTALLFRHIVEDPVSLRSAMEKVICATAPATLARFSPKEIHNVFRVLGPAACRDPDIFSSVASNILRLSSSTAVDDSAVQTLKTSLCNLRADDSFDENEVVSSLIYSLLHALIADPVEPEEVFDGENNSEAQPSASNKQFSMSDIISDDDEEESNAAADSEEFAATSWHYLTADGRRQPIRTPYLPKIPKDPPKEKKSDKHISSKNNPIIRKSGICRLLAELVKSYPRCARLIIEYTFQAGDSELITENYTALGFILDNLLHSSQTTGDKDTPLLAKVLIAALASSSPPPDVLSRLVLEVRIALIRALSVCESPEKHTRIQSLTELISTIVECCPAASSLNQLGGSQKTISNIVKVFLEEGIVVELARIPLHLDLSSPHMAATVNSALKALEHLSVIVNSLPPSNLAKKSRRRTSSTRDRDTVPETAEEGMEIVDAAVTTQDAENAVQDIELDTSLENNETPEALISTLLQEATSSTAADIGDANNAGSTVDGSEQQLLVHVDVDERASPVLIDVDDAQNSQFRGRSSSLFSDLSYGFLMDPLQESIDSDSNSESGQSHSQDDAENDEEDTDEVEEEEEGDDADEMEEAADEADDVDVEEEDDASSVDGSDFDFFRLLFQLESSLTPADRSSHVVVGRSGPVRRFQVRATAGETANGTGIPMTASVPPLPTVSTVHPLLTHNAVHIHHHLREHEPRASISSHIQSNSGSTLARGRHPNPPTILQRLLGPSSTQTLLQLPSESSTHPTSAAQYRFSSSGFRIISAEEEIFETQGPASINYPSDIFSSIPSTLSRWTEASDVLDKDSIHDCVTGLKPAILKCLEAYREAEKSQEEERRKVENKDKEKQSDAETSVVLSEVAEASNQTEAVSPTPMEVTESSIQNESELPATVASNEPDHSPTEETAASVSQEEPTLTTVATSSDSETTQRSSDPPSATRPETPMDTGDNEDPADYELSKSPVAEPSDIEGTDTSNPENAPVAASASAESEGDSASSRNDEPTSALDIPSEPSEPTVPESATSSEVSNIFDGVEIPEGVDPSFLAALPDNIRQEVISEQLRLQRLRQSSQNVSGDRTGDGSLFSEVNPEFLAALPATIQEEVLAQQRAEQQRLAAQNSNPDVPVDPANFLQTLPQGLRQQVLADIDNSLLAVLPPDLASEARALQRAVEARHHQIRERFLTSHSHLGNLSHALRTASRVSAGYSIRILTTSGGGRGEIHISSRNPAGIKAPPSTSPKIRGYSLLDREALTCLLVLLFLDEPELSIGRLHRVLRNLCHHEPTRHWIMKSLLSILDRTKDQQLPEVQDSRLMGESSSAESNKKYDSANKSGQPSWLFISLDAALGCRTNVLQIRRLTATQLQGDPQSSDTQSSRNPNTPLVTIHPLASPIICRHVFDALISFAKRSPMFFLPKVDKDKKLKGSKSQKSVKDISNHPSSSRHDTSNTNADNDFWDVLVKLDSLHTTSHKGKTVARNYSSSSLASSLSVVPDEESRNVGFSSSTLAQLIGLLAHPVVKRSSVLTDRLLKLLNHISSGLTDPNLKDKAKTDFKQQIMEDNETTCVSPFHEEEVETETTVGSETTDDPAMFICEDLPEQPTVKFYLMLVVEVLISKKCSEEGLEDATSFLLRVSYSCLKTRETVLSLLLHGARTLGSVVCCNIFSLMHDLKYSLSCDTRDKSAESDDKESEYDGKVPIKGFIHDRYTNRAVVLTAPVQIKGGGGKELRLQSMQALTSKASSQAFFLRILKVIVQLAESTKRLAEKSKTQPDVPDSGNDDTLTSDPSSDEVPPSNIIHLPNGRLFLFEADGSFDLSNRLKLDKLWDGLSDCLSELAKTADQHAVLVLQPAVEAFFLVHGSSKEDKKKENQRESQESEISQDMPPASSLSSISSQSDQNQVSDALSSSSLSSDTVKFLRFAETHQTVLNQILRQSTTPLAKGPFQVLVDHTRVLDFDVKRRYFRQELERLGAGSHGAGAHHDADIEVGVRRPHVFEDSYNELHHRPPAEWKKNFYIVFEGEEGQDAGGLLREWYTIISREIFNPMYALFTISPGDRVTYMINSSSHCNSNHLSYFKFVGRVIAKAVYDNKLLECYFTRSFYKHILGKCVKYTDMESEDYSFYQGLVFLLEHNVKEVGSELAFSIEVREFGVTEVRDLKPNGRNIPVCEENKQEYVRLVCQEKMTGAIRQQLTAFLEGFYEIIPVRLISIFDEQELELLISGLPSIDIDDLKANTEYHKYQLNSLQIQWFWRALRSFDQADRAKFLQFVTGTSKVPLQGFASLEGMDGIQKFQIHRNDRTDRLPTAHTCFNQLDLPAYETYDKLRSMLLKAIHECSEGFGFA